MLNKIKNRKQEGFTIIEVLIVLAIAGLIMLIVFLAVPALQRNTRNSQRQSDASKVATAISTCMGNRNGVVTSCDQTAELQAAGGLNTAELQQLTTVAPGGGIPANATTANFALGRTCSADASGGVAGTARQSTVTFNTETAGGLSPRCIST